MALSDKIVEALIGKPNTMPINVQSYIQNVGNEPYAQNLTPEQIQGIAQGLNYGNKDVARMQQSLGIPIPKTPEELALARQGKLNYQGRTGGILPDLGRGFQQNYNNNLVQSLGQPLKNPNLATTLGGGLGTLTKIIDSPVGRGLLAAGAVKALGGNGGQALAQGLNAGVIRQDMRAADQAYRKQMVTDLGMKPEEVASIRGNVTDMMYQNLANARKMKLQTVKYQDLAPFDEDIANAISQNPNLADKEVPSTVANTILAKKGLIGVTQADLNKAKAENYRNPKPRTTINIKQGGTKSVVEHKTSGNNDNSGSSKPVVKPKYKEGQTATNPKTGEKMIYKNGSWQKA